MSRKTELLKLFGEYKEKYNKFQTDLAEIEKNGELTQQGKEEARRKLVESVQPIVATYRDNAIGVIDKGLAALESKWNSGSIGKLTDGGYQAGLANVVKMLEMGAIKDENDIRNIIEAYKEDFNALAMIKSVLGSGVDSKIQGYRAMIPFDGRAKNRELLQKLKGNIDMYINVKTASTVLKTWNAFNSNNVNVASGMDSLSDFVTNNLGDDLELLS